ncbi:MAG: DUF3772 domain-containing protein [Marinosulfonomonas sp.]|nr:DUF3772 domain-containing protein [Marinosulfonomonas sp.]
MIRLLGSLLLALALVFGSGGGIGIDTGGAWAQTAPATIDFAAWGKVAERAETALEDQRASNTALEDLRAELASWRVQFQAAQSANNARITTLQQQIDVLGPIPAEGEDEPAEIVERRAALNLQLAALKTPQLSAEEAYRRADGLIRETDAIIRERHTASLLELGPSPLNPTLWPQALRSVSSTASQAVAEVKTAWLPQAQKEQVRERLPLTIIYLVVAAVLILRGRRWSQRLGVLMMHWSKVIPDHLVSFVVSIGQILLPYIGILALTEALFAPGLLGFRGQIIVSELPTVGLAILLALWLGTRLFQPAQGDGVLQEMSAGLAALGRRLSGWLGAVWGLNHLLVRLAIYEDYAAATSAVLHFPLILLGGGLLFRLSQVLRGTPKAEQTEGVGDLPFRARMANLLANTLMVIAVAGPLIAAIGYLSGALALVFPAMETVALLALVIVLSGVMRDAYGFASGRDEQATRDALMPVLLSLVLTLAALPVATLIWGARLSDLTELWARFRSGFQIGDSRISPTDFLTFAIVFAVGYLLTRLFQAALKSSVLPKTQIDPGGQNAIVSGLGYVGIFLAALIGISTAGIDLSSLAIVAGALSVGIGFGLQNIVSNFVSGIILLIERPIAEGDWIEVGGNMGYVRDISVRSTRIETFDRTDVIIPNADLVSGTVTNYTRGNLIGRAILPIGVAYGSDTHQVEAILKEIATAHPMVSLNPPPSVHFRGFGADSLDFEIRAILRDVNYGLSVKTALNHEIAKRFAEEGIEIPFAQRDVWLRNPEVLQPQPAPGRKAPKKPT